VNKIKKLEGKCPYCKCSKHLFEIFNFVHCNNCGHFCNPEDVIKNNLEKWIKKGVKS